MSFPRILSNNASASHLRSKVVKLSNGSLLEIRRGNITFSKDSQVKPQTFASEMDWYRYLWAAAMPLPEGAPQPRRLDFQEPLPETPKNTWGPSTGTTVAYLDGLLPGDVLSNKDATSKVVITKSRGLFEIRRGDITWRYGVKEPRHTWATLAEWKNFLESAGMNSDLIVFENGGGFNLSGITVVEQEAPPAPKKARTDAYVPDQTPVTLPAPDTVPALQLSRQVAVIDDQVKNRLIEQVKEQIASELRKDLDHFVIQWVQKLKID